MIKVGCCGFPVRMDKYFTEFNVVEVQKTFYDPRGINTFKKWREKASADFEFTVKAWQGITHSIKSPTWRRYKGELEGNKENYGLLRFTDEVKLAWKMTLDAANALKSRKIIIQLPPSLDWDSKKEEIIKTLKYFSSSNKEIILEPRHESWFSKEVYDIFNRLKITFCTDPFKKGIINIDSSKIIYLRLHGIGGYKYKYSDKELAKLYDMIKKYQDKEVYVMFNNVYMYNDAKRFKEQLARRF